MSDEPTQIDPLSETVSSDQAATAGLSESARQTIQSDAELREGTRLRHYRIVGLLGKGAMGAVYHAHDESLDRPVAVKILPPELSKDEKFIDRFVREARAQAMLSHPNVVPIYFIGEEDGRWFFAMEKVEGESLDALLERGERMAWEESLDVAEAVAKALRQGQDRGLIHRDIKPSNILVERQGLLKVADFGLAKPMAEITDEDKKLTQDGAFLGTPLYVAPEQARGEDVDHRVDMYALGATLYHLVSGSPPFDGDSLVAIIARHAGERPEVERLDASPAFRRFIGRLLEKRPDDRFETWDDVLEAVEQTRPLPYQPGGMFSRYSANVFDLFFVGFPLLAIPFGLPGVGLLIFFAYLVVGTAWKGTTLGKWAFGLRVIDARSTSKPSLRQALIRNATLWFAIWFLAGIEIRSEYFTGPADRPYKNEELLDAPLETQIVVGFIFALPLIYAAIAALAARDPENRGFHDRLAGTRVVQ